MSYLLDRQYLMMMSRELDGFKQMSQTLWNCRCPICGDSKRSRIKARGFFLPAPNGDKILYKCHNCGVALSFRSFLEQVNPRMFKEYTLDSLRERGIERKIDDSDVTAESFASTIPSAPLPRLDKNSVLEPLTPICDLSVEHPARMYIAKRKIPENFWRELFYTDNFKRYVHSLLPDKFSATADPEERIVIPFVNRGGEVYGLAGRALSPENPIRYFTIALRKGVRLIYGLERLDLHRPILVCEGQFDSMFLPNALAVAGSNYDCELIERLKPQITLVPDNERRNREVCKLVAKMIGRGFRVCLWREDLPFKDINEAILLGYTQQDIVKMIEEDSCQGLEAEIRYKLWRKF